MKLNNRRELFSAALMLFVGIGTTVGSLNYDMGTLVRMGPGYFPLILGVVLMFFGALVLITPSNSDDSEMKLPAKRQIMSWLIIVTGIMAFMVLGKYGGLVPATFVLIFVAALADRSNSLVAALTLAALVTIAAVVVFHFGLQLQFPLFTWG